MMTAADNLSSLLLEIGTEEIPARFLPPALVTLKQNAESILRDHLIDFSDVRTYATPRRLALLVKGIPGLQKDMVKEVFGPARKIAYDDQGNPSKAALGFAQSQGVRVEDLRIRSKDKGEYVVAVLQHRGVPVKEVLPEVVRKTILSLTFPKSMRWGDRNFRFARPIHWILAVLNAEVIPVEIDGIKSGNVTKGHRFLSPGTFALKEIASYRNLLENNYVIVDQEERKAMIEKGIETLASAVEGTVLRDEGLVETVTYLVEYPVPVLCEFPARYLSLPKELLTTVMKDHQKYFAVRDSRGNLRNHFVVVSNTKDENAPTIKIGAERVIRARFEDARFYYEEDLKRPLASRIEDLKRVTFHDRLGSLYDKTERIVGMATFLSERLYPAKREQVERAAWLCKTDLITGVVKEFPELQGLMGRYYALHDGEQRVVATAIEEHYLPAFSGDKVPATDEGALVSLADKIDNVVSFYAVGLTPTGSEDPFALRRQALAVIAVLLERAYDVTLREMITKAGETAVRSRPALADEVLAFMSQRIEPLLSSLGLDADVIHSTLHLVADTPLHKLKDRMEAIQRFTADGEYPGVLLALKRINNILPDSPLPSVTEALLTESQERTLYSELQNTKPLLAKLVGERRMYDALKLLSALTPSVNSFFDKVLVMDKREEVRLNRLALLRELWSLALVVADFSKLAETR